MPPFRHTLRVRYHECDAQERVFNAHFLMYFDLAVTELWRTMLGSYAAMVERGVDVVVAEARARYLAPARFDDVLDVDLRVTRLGTTSTTIALDVLREGERLVEGEVRHVYVTTDGYAKTPIPGWLRAALAPYAEQGTQAARAV